MEILEEDLYRPISAFLNGLGFTVRSEVDHCDVTAIKDDTLLIIEMKKSLNLDVIIQAVKRQKLTDEVYIAVPDHGRKSFTKKWNDACHLLRRLELGLMLVSTADDPGREDGVRVLFEPGEFKREASRNRNKKRKARLIQEHTGRSGDYNKGGSRGRKLVTTYREKAICIACCLEKSGVLSPKQLKQLGSDKKKTNTILTDNYYGWFIHESIGKYCLSESGRAELNKYPALADHFRDEIEKARVKMFEDKKDK